MLPYLHASLCILVARKSNFAACSLELQFPGFLTEILFRTNLTLPIFYVDAEMQGSCGIRRLAVLGALVSFHFAVSRSAYFFIAAFFSSIC